MNGFLKKVLSFLLIFTLIFSMNISAIATGLSQEDVDKNIDKQDFLETGGTDEPLVENGEGETNIEESQEPKPEAPAVVEPQVEEPKVDSPRKSELDVDGSASKNDPPIAIPKSILNGPRIQTAALEDTIQLSKKAERVFGECRAYEITLTITGTPQPAPVDVVLIIDKSGSMNETTTVYTPITSAPSNNGSYYVKINGSYRQITRNSGTGANSVWRYGIQSGWSTTYYYVKWDPNGDDNSHGGSSSVGKPFYTATDYSRLYYAKQAAVNFAAKVLHPTTGIPGSRVSLVTFSGPSTTSGNGAQSQAQTVKGLISDVTELTNAINGITAVGGTNTEAGFLEGRSVIESTDRPNSKKVVIMFTDGLPTASNGNRYAESTNINHAHNQAAINAGKGIFEDEVADVFTVGLVAGMNATERTLAENILNQTQNKGRFITDSAANLNAIFDAISTELAYAATNAKVTDVIGNNFTLIESSLPSGVTSSDGKVFWNPGTIKNKAEISFMVRAKKGITGNQYTNEWAKIDYTDVNGNQHRIKEFDRPSVNVPKDLEVSLTDATIALGQSVNLGGHIGPITGGDAGPNGTPTRLEDVKSWKWEKKVGNNWVAVSTEKNPTVNPTEDTIYRLTIVDKNNCSVSAEMLVRVTTKIGSITVKKVVQNPKAGDEDRKFDIFVVGPNIPGRENQVWTLRLKDGQSKTIAGLEPGTYTINETLPMNYRLISVVSGGAAIGNGGSITLTSADKDKNVTVTNEPRSGWFYDEDEKENKFTIGIQTTSRILALPPEDIKEKED